VCTSFSWTGLTGHRRDKKVVGVFVRFSCAFINKTAGFKDAWEEKGKKVSTQKTLINL
jgi:hypothetical protein